MPFSQKYLSRLAGLVVAGTALCVAIMPSPAQAASLDGVWVGGGFVEPREGRRESVRCRVRYSQVTSNVYSVSARCASPSGRIDQTGEVVRVNANRYVGDFYNAQFNVSGRARVRLNGSSQSVTLWGGAGSGRLTLRKR
jgi:hypothetical protein